METRVVKFYISTLDFGNTGNLRLLGVFWGVGGKVR